MPTTHTPGPWAHHNHQSPLIYSKTTGEIIAQVFEFDNGTRGHLRKGDSAADARLICAAPKLLAALKEIVGQDKPNRYGYDAAGVALDDDWRARARAALSLATTGD